jgi:hypothetical protein
VLVICIKKDQQYALICTTPLFYVLAPTCFGSSLPSSGSFLDPPELLEIQIEWVVYHIMCGYVTCAPDCPALYCVGSAGTRGGATAFSDRTLRPASHGGDYIAPRGHMQCKSYKSFGHTQRYCGYAPQCVACGKTHLSGECSTTQPTIGLCPDLRTGLNSGPAWRLGSRPTLTT